MVVKYLHLLLICLVDPLNFLVYSISFRVLTVMLNSLLDLVLQFVNLVRELLVFLLVLADLSDVLINAVFLIAMN